jgi:hypothetical protein
VSPRPVVHARDHWAGGADPSPGPWVGVTDYEGTWSGTVRYRHDGHGDTELDGEATGGDFGEVITYLPAEYWPVADKPSPAWLTSAGQVVQAVIAAADGAVTITEITAGGGAYAAYTPTWTSTGTAPAIGNASIVARYSQIGEIVHAYGFIAFGSSSTYGTGSYTFALPVNAVQTYLIGTTFMFDNSTGNLMQGLASTSGASLFSSRYGATYGGTITDMGQTAPWTWAENDVFAWNIRYELA